jgi:adenosylhomocysteine nucleosidase
MLALFVALRLEGRAIERHLRGLERNELEGVRLLSGRALGKDVALCLTGVGGGAASEAARRAIGHLSPRAAICLGLAGGAVDGVRVGDLVLARRTVLYGGRAWVESDPALLELARQATSDSGLRRHEGTVVTVPRFLPLEEEKRSVGAEMGALAVEMEGYHVGVAAAEAGVPFLSVRVVSDAVGHSLRLPPELLDPHRPLTPWRAAQALARRPLLAPTGLLWLANLRRAAGALGRFAGPFLQRWARSDLL